jgi:hypothetical protein
LKFLDYLLTGVVIGVVARALAPRPVEEYPAGPPGRHDGLTVRPPAPRLAHAGYPHTPSRAALRVADDAGSIVVPAGAEQARWAAAARRQYGYDPQTARRLAMLRWLVRTGQIRED